MTITLCTQALTGASLDPRTHLHLLDTRAESHIARGSLDAAAQDAATMVSIVQSGNRQPPDVNHELAAIALNRQALVQMQTGELKTALKSSHAALAAARQSRQAGLIGQSLLCLGEAQLRTAQNKAALESGQEAVALFQEVGDPSGSGRSYWLVAMACYGLRQVEAARRAAQTALELCRQAGNQPDIGKAYNTFAFTDVDMADRIKHLQQAQRAYEHAGFLERQIVALGNLANVYYQLGLFRRSRRLHRKLVKDCRRPSLWFIRAPPCARPLATARRRPKLFFRPTNW